MSRLRVSSHRLEIEAGRWTKTVKTPLVNRKCKMCNVLEDEFHFILECPLYRDLRTELISKYFWRRPNMPKFVELCMSEAINRQKKISMFIEKAFKIRKLVLYH